MFVYKITAQVGNEPFNRVDGKPFTIDTLTLQRYTGAEVTTFENITPDDSVRVTGDEPPYCGRLNLTGELTLKKGFQTVDLFLTPYPPVFYEIQWEMSIIARGEQDTVKVDCDFILPPTAHLPVPQGLRQVCVNV